MSTVVKAMLWMIRWCHVTWFIKHVISTLHTTKGRLYIWSKRNSHRSPMMLATTLSVRKLSRCMPLQPSFSIKIFLSVSHTTFLGRQSSQRHRMSTALQSREEPLPLGTMLKSGAGWTYKIEEILTDRRKPLLCVYRARCVWLNQGSTLGVQC